MFSMCQKIISVQEMTEICPSNWESLDIAVILSEETWIYLL